MNFAISLVVGLILLVSQNSFGQKTGDKTDSDSYQAKIQEIIKPLVDSNNYSGSVVVKKGNRKIFGDSFGYADREGGIRTKAQTKFFLASVSAMFTAAATMKLVEAGKISLDDKVSKFLPRFKNGEKMTIHHLLTERSGIPRIGSQGKVDYSKLTESPQTIDALIGYFREYELKFEPGSNYEHSRSSYILLAKIIEEVSGKPFGEYLKKEIFEPLKMQNSGHFEFSAIYEEIPNLAKGYTQSGVTDLAPAQAIHWSSKTGHASIYSTAEDLILFADAVLKKKLLSADSWAKILTSHHDSGVGYGWFVANEGKRRRFHMSGGSPGFSSFIAIYPDEEVSIAMLSNIQIHVPYFTVPKLASVVLGEPYKELNLVTPPDVEESNAETYVGTYRFEDGFYNPRGIVVISRVGNRLFADGGPLIPIEEGTKKFKKFIHRQYWSTLEFIGDVDGNAMRLKFDNFIGTRVVEE